ESLRRALHAWVKKHTAETPIPAALAGRLLGELNERVLGDPTFGPSAEQELDGIQSENRSAFDNLCHEDVVPWQGIFLTPAHERIRIYTWQNADCCLEAGATEC